MMKKQEMVDAEKRVMPVVPRAARHRTGHGRACSRLERCHIDDKQKKRQAALRRRGRRMTGLAAGVTALMCLLTLWPVQAQAAELPIQSRAALLMEKTTGQVLYARNEHEQLEPASVTKIMTLLLTMEAIDSGTIGYDDVVTVSAYAAGMGGSQVYLAEGEQITVEELLKAVCVASGNDAAAALAEKVAGVSDRFVEKMNQRAAELGMNDTHFANCTGLTAAPEQPLMPVPVDMGTADTVQPVLASEGNTVLVEKEKAGMLERKVTLEPRVTAPVAAGQPLGELTVLDGDTVLLTVPITAGEDVMRRSWGQVFTQLLRLAVFAG